MIYSVLEAWICECIREPRWENNLEWYDLGHQFVYKKIQTKKETYYRIFPEVLSYYSETCGPNIFRKFFKII